ncbi:MAG: hypothetical protein AVDCRST_MAG22-160, partial [uncultured Rubrobacteraceae bacterium]
EETARRRPLRRPVGLPLPAPPDGRHALRPRRLPDHLRRDHGPRHPRTLRAREGLGQVPEVRGRAGRGRWARRVSPARAAADPPGLQGGEPEAPAAPGGTRPEGGRGRRSHHRRLPADAHDAGPYLRPLSPPRPLRPRGRLRALPPRPERHLRHRARAPRAGRPRLLHLEVSPPGDPATQAGRLAQRPGRGLRPLRRHARASARRAAANRVLFRGCGTRARGLRRSPGHCGGRPPVAAGRGAGSRREAPGGRAERGVSRSGAPRAVARGARGRGRLRVAVQDQRAHAGHLARQDLRVPRHGPTRRGLTAAGAGGPLRVRVPRRRAGGFRPDLAGPSGDGREGPCSDAVGAEELVACPVPGDRGIHAGRPRAPRV